LGFARFNPTEPTPRHRTMTAEETPINLVCTCGHAFRVRGRAAGRVVKCPGCSAGVKVPDAEPQADSFNFIDDAPSFPAVAFTPAINTTPPNLPKDATNGTPSLPSVSPKKSFSVGGVARSLIGDIGPSIQAAALPPSRTYPALEIVAGILRVLAVLLLIASFYIIGKTKPDLSMQSEVELWIMTSFAIGIVSSIFAVLLFAVAQLIGVVIHIQGNTLATANASQR